ncbi:hypothetical protein [Streptomyces sp. SPB074]|uniref:hypothetical protein n=1 Tax=Streptomyces sp. (strain SPB074) TaxID=465543 RepID=UPI001F26EC8D|nr:hypothetical protein [Streptomyces sp. SPB074]
MPGRTTAARILLFVHAGGFALLGLALCVGGPTLVRAIVHSDGTMSPESGRDTITTVTWVTVLLGTVYLFVALWGILTASWFGRDSPRVRVSGIVWASVAIPLSLVLYIFFLIALASAVLIIVFLALNESAEWFRAPRED